MAKKLRPELTRFEAESAYSVLAVMLNDPDTWGPGGVWTRRQQAAVVRAIEALGHELRES